MRVIAGQEEARLSAQGILLGWPNANGLVCDIGGASMELAHISHGNITSTETSPLGPMQFADHNMTQIELDAEIDKRLDILLAQFDTVQDQLFLVGGSWRAIAKLDMAISKYPLRILDAYSPDLDVFDATLEHIIDLPLEDKMALTGTSPARLSLVPMAARVLRRLLRKLTLNRLLVSAYGLREGLLYEGMPKNVRDEDPLLIAAQAREQASARFPRFGEELAQWVMPLFPEISNGHKRLVTAACHLHDVSWRSHPDYRSELCFDNATRTDLGGLLHSERMILAMAQRRRYKSWEKTDQFVAIKKLLSPEDVQFAQTLGIAMRLGALMAGPSSEFLGELRIADDTLEWVLGAKSQVLFGEVTQRRFNALADTLGKKPVVIIA
jgi:exopolyphosphatase/guanosine-5'-triphosphate,3'-diphosphate pyrophosphatase